MSKIDCTVNNCSHNKKGSCYANRVNIGGKSAEKDDETCCGSFLNEMLYSDLTNNAYSQGSCDCLVCHVKSCNFNENSLCSLDDIQVGGENVEIYTQTCCRSFESK
ncbi:DUF1540 domain-containing protein [Clostridium paraputrificum]|uniref:DUF1540 domain-containing protein n=1 Tax=Clostridium TaxID=1485 RepID=UPI003D33D7C5